MKNSDADMIQRTLEGDQQAFTALVEKYQKQVHALAWQKIGDFHIAQEIAQDTFLTAYQNLRTLTHHSQLAGWLYVVTNNKCKNWHRKKRLTLQSLETTDPVEIEEAYYSAHIAQQREEAANQKRRAIVQKLLSKLKESDRTIVNLYYIAEMPCEEIGKFLGVSTNTVRSRLHRARNRLRKEEAMIKENIASFQLPAQLTENIMKKISHLNPMAPSGNKPLVPLGISAASAIIVVLLIGFGTQNLIRFQKPFSLESTSERTIEIVDVPIVLESPIQPAVRQQVGSSNVLGKSDGVGQKPDTTLLAAAQSDSAEIPNSEAQWGQTNGPYGGNIRTLFATSEGILFAGIGNMGIFRSTDLGDSWVPASVELLDVYEGLEIVVLAFAQNKDTFYASVTGGLYKSTDSGKSWHYVPTDPQDSPISGIVTIGDRIYISSNPGRNDVGGVWYSDDEKSWTPMNDGMTDLRIREFANIGTTLVVGTEDGVFRKKATEDSWHPINSGFTAQPIDEEPIIKEQIELGFNPPPRPLFPSGIRVDSIAAMDNLLYIGVYMGKDGGLFRSDDEGDSWARISTKEMGRAIEGLAVSESTLYASSFGGEVFRSVNKGDSWMPVSKGMTVKAALGLVAINADTVFASTLGGSIFRTKDGGNSWVKANAGIMGTSIVDLEVLGDRIYAFTGDSLFYTTDAGETWVQIENSPKPYDFSFKEISALNEKLYIGALRFAPNSHGGVVGGVFQLDEQSNSLIEVKTGREMYAVECMHIVGTTFYVGTQGKGVFLWNEGWDSWLNLGLKGQVISEIAVRDSVYVRTRRGEIFRFKDHQTPWEQIKDKKAHRRFTESRKIDNKLYLLSGREGLIQSLDGGNSWTQLDDGIEHVSIGTVESSGTDFYIGTTQHGVFKWLHKDEKWEQLGSLSLPAQSLAVLDGFLYAGTQAGVHRIQIEK